MKTNLKALAILAVICLFPITENVYGQETDTLRISGIVTDPSGSPLPGASILIKGANTGTVTDSSGKYSLSVPENAVLKFLFLGYAMQEIVVGTQREINVSMVEAEMQEGGGIEPAKPINLTAEQKEKARADNSFAFKMFREVSKQQGANTFFSPFSLNMAMGMLYNGASGATRTEMAKALGVANIPENEINEYYKKMSQALLEIDPTTELRIANSIWYRNKFPVKNTFIETGKNYFDAEVRALDFDDSAAVGIINSWCADKTNNRISHIVSGLPDDMAMLLVNALYFKSKWQREKRFDKDDTKVDDFTKAGNQKIKVNMMEQTTSLPYYADQHLQCVELPYGNQAFSMVAILPPENTNIDRLIDHLPDVKWQDIMGGMQQKRVWLKLPRFKMECDFSLNQPVADLGMKRIFKGGFGNISDESLWVSDIVQKTFVEVNEEGTEAAAVTAVVIVGYGIARREPAELIHFFADRPFLILIREKSTGVILFVGRIDEPRE